MQQVTNTVSVTTADKGSQSGKLWEGCWKHLKSRPGGFKPRENHLNHRITLHSFTFHYQVPSVLHINDEPKVMGVRPPDRSICSYVGHQIPATGNRNRKYSRKFSSMLWGGQAHHTSHQMKVNRINQTETCSDLRSVQSPCCCFFEAASPFKTFSMGSFHMDTGKRSN